MKLTNSLVRKSFALVYNQKTRRSYKSCVRDFVDKEITLDAFQSVISGWVQNPSGTISVKRAATKRLVKWLAVEAGTTDFSGKLIWPKGKPSKKGRPISDEELAAIRKTATGVEERLLVAILESTGLRLGTCAELTVRCLLSESCEVASKRGRVVKIYPTAKVKAITLELVDKEELGFEDYVFRTLDGEQVTYKFLWQIYKRMTEDANVGVTSHSYRHKLASDLDAEGVTAPRIQIVLGHKSLDSTMRYITPDESEIKEAVLDRARRLQ